MIWFTDKDMEENPSRDQTDFFVITKNKTLQLENKDGAFRDTSRQNVFNLSAHTF